MIWSANTNSTKMPRLKVTYSWHLRALLILMPCLSLSCRRRRRWRRRRWTRRCLNQSTEKKRHLFFYRTSSSTMELLFFLWSKPSNPFSLSLSLVSFSLLTNIVSGSRMFMYNVGERTARVEKTHPNIDCSRFLFHLWKINNLRWWWSTKLSRTENNTNNICFSLRSKKSRKTLVNESSEEAMVKQFALRRCPLQAWLTSLEYRSSGLVWWWSRTYDNLWIRYFHGLDGGFDRHISERTCSSSDTWLHGTPRRRRSLWTGWKSCAPQGCASVLLDQIWSFRILLRRSRLDRLSPWWGHMTRCPCAVLKHSDTYCSLSRRNLPLNFGQDCWSSCWSPEAFHPLYSIDQ